MKNREQNFVSDWVPVFTWMLVIFTASSNLGSSSNTARFLLPLLLWFDPHLSANGLLMAQLIVRKGAHLTEYAVFAMLLLRALRSWLPARLPRQAGLALLIAATYAASDEFHQMFVPSRTASVEDVMIDACGALIGVVIYWLLAWRPDPGLAEAATR